MELLAELNHGHDKLGQDFDLVLRDLGEETLDDLSLRDSAEHRNGHPNSLTVDISDIHTSLVMEENLM